MEIPRFTQVKHKEKTLCCINCRPAHCICSVNTSIYNNMYRSCTPCDYCVINEAKLRFADPPESMRTITDVSGRSIKQKCLNSDNKLPLNDNQLDDTKISKHILSIDKTVSEIVKKKQPYKEIEAIINNNRVIIRTHKDPIKEEYDPPCECLDEASTAIRSSSSLTKCDNGTVFEMADGNLELCRVPRSDSSTVKETSDQEDTGCRTIMLYPDVDVQERYEAANVKFARPTDGRKERHDDKEKMKMKASKLMSEENPNIFLLRIKKKRANGNKLDLEFRAPRPWLLK